MAAGGVGVWAKLPVVIGNRMRGWLGCTSAGILENGVMQQDDETCEIPRDSIAGTIGLLRTSEVEGTVIIESDDYHSESKTL
jgi:hypothetical protein